MSDINETLKERNETHGSFEKNAEVVQHFKQWAKVSPKYNALSDSAKEALDNIFQKIGRILTGDPTHIDSWHDIAGYATLEKNILSKKENTNEIDAIGKEILKPTNEKMKEEVKKMILSTETLEVLRKLGVPLPSQPYWHGPELSSGTPLKPPYICTSEDKK